MQNQTITDTSKAPVHMLSAVTVIALDWIWGLGEGFASITILGMVMLPLLSITVFIVTFTAVFLIQRFLENDRYGACAAKAFGLGIVAAVPYQVLGTAVGGTLLAWAGIKQLKK